MQFFLYNNLNKFKNVRRKLTKIGDGHIGI